MDARQATDVVGDGGSDGVHQESRGETSGHPTAQVQAQVEFVNEKAVSASSLGAYHHNNCQLYLRLITKNKLDDRVEQQVSLLLLLVVRDMDDLLLLLCCSFYLMCASRF